MLERPKLMKNQNRTRITIVSQLARAICSVALIVVAIALLPPSFAQVGKQLASQDQPQSCTVAAGPDMPTVLVRAVGVYFPANGRFYAMGGRSSDTAGSDQQNPREYNPGTNSWTIRPETTPDNFMNNMACGVLTDAGTPYIYCVGGSFAGGTTATDRVFRFNPVAGTLTTVAAPWPGAMGTILPGGFAVYNNKLYILGGFNINVGMDTNIWEFTPGTNTWVHKAAMLPMALGYIPTATIGSFLYTAGGSMWTGTTIADVSDSYRYDPTADAITTIALPPRVVAETRSLPLGGQAYVMGGGRTAPNPNNEVDIYNPPTNTWALGTAMLTARRNFPTDTNGTDHIWLAGGYANDGVTPLASMEIFTCSAPLTITNAVSRKTHGTAGTFDVTMPLSGATGVECRNTGGTHDYTLVVAFSQNVTVNGNPQAQVTVGTGCVGSAGVCNGNVSVSGNIVTVPLTNIADVQNINVQINSVNSSGNFSVPMGFLTGDTNGNRTVNAADVAQTKSQLGQTVTASNFRNDVNANGTINAADTALVKQNSGHSIP
jgi:N-acetylneuraminic acid mutarotase